MIKKSYIIFRKVFNYYTKKMPKLDININQ